MLTLCPSVQWHFDLDRIQSSPQSQKRYVTHGEGVALRSEDSAISSLTNKSFRISIAHPILSLISFSRIFAGVA
jgi:hypothetical protein